MSLLQLLFRWCLDHLPWQLYRVVLAVQRVVTLHQVIQTLRPVLVGQEKLTTTGGKRSNLRCFGFFLWVFGLCLRAIECLSFFLFLLDLIKTFLVIDRFKEQKLLTIVSGTMCVILHDVLDRIGRRKRVLVLCILKIETFREKVKVMRASKCEAPAALQRYLAIENWDHMRSLVRARDHHTTRMFL